MSSIKICNPNQFFKTFFCELSGHETSKTQNNKFFLKLPGGNDNVNCDGSYLEINENEVGVEKKCGYERETGSIFGSGAKSLKLSFVTSLTETQRLAQGFWLEIMGNLVSSLCFMKIRKFKFRINSEPTE